MILSQVIVIYLFIYQYCSSLSINKPEAVNVAHHVCIVHAFCVMTGGLVAPLVLVAVRTAPSGQCNRFLVNTQSIQNRQYVLCISLIIKKMQG